MKIAALFIAAISALCGQPSPQLTWEGQVDGIVVLHVHKEKVDIEYRQGQPVERQSFRFIAPLPDTRQDVRVEVREGRGAVRVTEQPRIENNFTAAVTIEDRQDGAAFYSLALYWDEPGTPTGRMEHLSWKGFVERDMVVACRARECEPAGRSPAKFTRPLPDHDVRVWLDETGGRGDTQIVEQPSARNNYTVKVAIRAFAGGGDCSFLLSWARDRTGTMPSNRKPIR